MEIAWQIKIIVLFCLIVLSAFFSGSEVALFSLNLKKNEKSFGTNKLILRYLKTLLDRPRRLLVTILIGNTVANVGASIVAVSLAIEYAEFAKLSFDLILTIQIFLLTLVVLLFGELIPKVFASKNAIPFSKFATIPMYFISAVLFPLAEIITEAIRFISSKIKIDKFKSAITESEISDLAELGQETGTIEEEEQEIISSLVEFKSVLVGEIMTPRVDIISVPIDILFEKLIKVIDESGHSRIPLLKNNLDEVIGFVYAKDLLPYIKDDKSGQKLSLKNIARSPIFVPKTKRISELLKEFQEKKMHIAVVVDEYGGTAGIVTLEDIIEEVVGEIWDEFDKEEDQINKIDETTYNVLGKTPITAVNEILNEEVIPEDSSYDTIGGWILNSAGDIPKEGFSFVQRSYRFTVKEIIKKRIKKIIIEKPEV